MLMKKVALLKLPALIIVIAALAGCVQDTASYMIDDNRNHAITLSRAQQWFWDDRVSVAVIAARQPDCFGGLDIKQVPRSAELVLYRAPEDYPEPIFIMEVKGQHYAISTLSCKVQKFATAPDDKGAKIGVFKDTDGRLRFVATNPATH